MSVLKRPNTGKVNIMEQIIHMDERLIDEDEIRGASRLKVNEHGESFH